MEIIVQDTTTRAQRSLVVQKQEVWIGRDPTCDVHLPSPFISDKHARVTLTGQQYKVETFGINGTFCNGRDLVKGRAHSLLPQDRLTIAQYVLSVLPEGQGAVSSLQHHQKLATQVRELLRSLHTNLLKRIDLRDGAREPTDPAHAQIIRRHLDAAIEEQIDTIPSDLLDFIVRRTFRDGLLFFIDTIGRSAVNDDTAPPQRYVIPPHAEPSVHEAMRRLARQEGLQLGKDTRKADLDRLAAWFQRATGQPEVALSRLLAREAVRRWLTKELSDLIFGLGPLQDLLEDRTISEIMVVTWDQIFVERDGVLEDSGRSFPSEEIVYHIAERIVGRVGRRIDQAQPLVDARLPDGSRVNVIDRPLAVKGLCITIRKFPQIRLTAEDLVANDTITAPVMDFLRACVLGKKNIIVSGGTGSGKTTFLNILSAFIPPDERIITIEDTAEVLLFHPHVVTLESRPANVERQGAITIGDLVRNALRMRPDRIIVGECRGPETLDMLQAMNTGHDGSLTTAHANSPEELMLRLETMVLMAKDIAVRPIRQQIAAGIDIVVQIERMKDGKRRVTHVAHVVGVDKESGEMIVEDIFRLPQDESEPPMLVHTGYLPPFLDTLVARGTLSLESLFE